MMEIKNSEVWLSVISGIGGTLIGVFLGWLTTIIADWNKTSKLKKDFKSEIQLNLKEIDRLQALINQFEKRLLAHDISLFDEIIKIKFLYWTFKYIVQEGKIHECLRPEIVYILDDVYRDMCEQGEINANKDLASLKTHLYEYPPSINNPSGFNPSNWSIVKLEGQKQFAYWRTLLAEHKTNLENILQLMS